MGFERFSKIVIYAPSMFSRDLYRNRFSCSQNLMRLLRLSRTEYELSKDPRSPTVSFLVIFLGTLPRPLDGSSRAEAVKPLSQLLLRCFQLLSQTFVCFKFTLVTMNNSSLVTLPDDIHSSRTFPMVCSLT